VNRPKRPATLPLTATERRQLDDLIGRGARHLSPAEGNRLLRLWQQDQADRAQEQRSAGGAARGALRLSQQLKETTARAEQAEADRNAFADRVDSLTEVARNNKAAYKAVVHDLEQLHAQYGA
jgi:hypothetical protein